MDYRTAGVISQSFATFEFDAELYGALSVASRLAANLKNRANVFHIAFSLRSVATKLDELFQTVDAAFAGKIPNDPNAELATPEKMRATADNIEHLYHSLEYGCEAMRRVGLMNNTLTAGSLKRIKSRCQDLLDLADLFEVSAAPKEVDAIFERAAEERSRGAFINLGIE